MGWGGFCWRDLYSRPPRTYLRCNSRHLSRMRKTQHGPVDVNYIMKTSCWTGQMDKTPPHLIPDTKERALFLVSALAAGQDALLWCALWASFFINCDNYYSIIRNSPSSLYLLPSSSPGGALWPVSQRSACGDKWSSHCVAAVPSRR